MAHWAVIIPADRWATERLFHHDTLTMAGSPSAHPIAGDEVLLVAAGDQPQSVTQVAAQPVGQVRAQPVGQVGAQPVAQVVAIGVVAPESDAETLRVTYTRRAFDEAVPADELKLDPSVAAIEPEVFHRLAARLGGDRDRRPWLVSVALPIEAINPAEAVRQFWSYVLDLGPAELPTYVWPAGDEMAMQAFVLGAEANQDPEEDGPDPKEDED